MDEIDRICAGRLVATARKFRVVRSYARHQENDLPTSYEQIFKAALDRRGRPCTSLAVRARLAEVRS